MYQHDSSHHLWVPLLKKRQAILLTEDDYSRKVVGGRMVEVESSWEHLVLTRGVIERYGRPLAYYVDNHSIFSYVGYSGRHYRYLKGSDEGEVQFKRALESLGIGLVYTGKGRAQAKGKVEKRFDYFQRRLPYLCERYRIRSIEAAQQILDDLIDYYNDRREHDETGGVPSRRWKRAIREGKGRVRALDGTIELDWVFSIHGTRRVKKDGTITFGGIGYRVGRYPGEKVTVCLIPEIKIMVYRGMDKLCEYHL